MARAHEEKETGTAVTVWLAAGLVIGLVLARLPAQASAGSLRRWVLAGILPVALFWAWRRGALVIGERGLRWAAAWWLLAILCALQGAFGVAPWPGAAVAEGLHYLGIAAALLLGTAVPRGSWHRLAPAIAAAGALAAVPTWFVEAGSFRNPNHAAAFIAFAALWTLAGAASAKTVGGMRVRIVLGALAIIEVTALAHLDSLGAIAGFAAGLVAMLFMATGDWSWGRRLALIGGLLGIGFAAIAWNAGTVAEHLQGRFFLFEVSASAMDPFGVGAGQFGAFYSEAQAAWFADHAATTAGERGMWTLALHAHNEALHTAVELGIGPATLFIVPILFALLRPGAGPAWPTVIAAVVIGQVSTSLHEPTTAAMAALCVGLCLRQQVVTAQASPGSISMRALVAALAAMTAIGGFAATSLDMVADRMTFAGAEQRAPETLVRAASVALRPARPERFAAHVLEDTDPARGLELATSAARRQPSPVAWTLAGRAAFAAGDLDRAIAAWEESIRLHPWFFAGYFNLARAWEDKGDRARARRYADRARSLRPKDPRLLALPE